MESIFSTGLILFTLSSLSAKHVFIEKWATWERAQAYCREHHTDLSPITNELEDEVFRSFFGGDEIGGWIGLYRDPSSPREWEWSGGTSATYMKFNHNYADKFTYVYWRSDGWNGLTGSYAYFFFCFNLIVDEVKKTWEEALEHCREIHTDLTSLNSETETLLALSEMNDNITEPVWIGLRFLGDTWLWVNGDPLVYEAWPEGDQDHQCPVWRRCGVLTKEGLWENRDCEEKLNFICY